MTNSWGAGARQSQDCLIARGRNFSTCDECSSFHWGLDKIRYLSEILYSALIRGRLSQFMNGVRAESKVVLVDRGKENRVGNYCKSKVLLLQP